MGKPPIKLAAQRTRRGAATWGGTDESARRFRTSLRFLSASLRLSCTRLLVSSGAQSPLLEAASMDDSVDGSCAFPARSGPPGADTQKTDASMAGDCCQKRAGEPA